jgi:hypothetical protein
VDMNSRMFDEQRDIATQRRKNAEFRGKDMANCDD